MPQQSYMGIDAAIDRDGHKAIWNDLLYALGTHKLAITIVFVLTLFSSYAIVQMRTELYETSATVLVKLGRENLEAPATVEKGSVFTSGVRREEVNSEITLLLSPQLIEATVDKLGTGVFLVKEKEPREYFKRLRYRVKKQLKQIRQHIHEYLIMAGLEKRLDDRSRIVKSLRQQIQAQRVRDSDVIRLNLLSPNPVLAEEILHALLDLYHSKHVEVRRSARIQDFFQDQVVFFQGRIKDLEQARSILHEHSHISSIADQREQLLSRLNALYSELGNLVSQQQAMLARGKSMRTVLRPTTLPTSDAMSTLAPLNERLTQLKLQRAKLLQTFDSDAVIVKNLADEIMAVEGLLAETLEQRIKLWRKRADRLEQKLASLNDAEIQLQSLEREQKLSELNYFNYSKRKEDARISDELDLRRVSNVAVMSYPESSIEPVQPRKLLIMVLSLPLGLILGMVVALLLEYVNDTIRTYRDLTGIKGMTYLGEFRRTT